MNEIEEKYKRFILDENMRELFRHSSIDIEGQCHKKESFIITTVVIDHTVKSTKPKEKNDAKLV